jgi:hypothetical protein
VTARARESLPPTFRPMSRSAGCALGRLRSSELAWGRLSAHGAAQGGPARAALAERLTAQRLRSRAWLAEGLRLTKIHRRLAPLRACGFPTARCIASRGASGGSGRRPARVVEPPSGEVAEVDFGLFGLWPDPTTGHRARSADSSSPSAIAATRFSGCVCGSSGWSRWASRRPPPSSRSCGTARSASIAPASASPSARTGWPAVERHLLRSRRRGKTFLAHRTHQIAMEGPSLRAARAPSSPKGKRRTNESAASRG